MKIVIDMYIKAGIFRKVSTIKASVRLQKIPRAFRILRIFLILELIKLNITTLLTNSKKRKEKGLTC